MSSELFGFFFGLLTAISWGTGDFNGGIASRRCNVFTVIVISQFFGLLILISVVFIFLEPFSDLIDLLWGVLAGLCGAIGLIALYRGLAFNKMSFVAPISAVIAVLIPMLIGIMIEGSPSIYQILGFLISIIAVWLISGTKRNDIIQFNSLDSPIIAGLGFGFFQVFIDRVSEGTIFWPLIAARITSLIALTVIMVISKQIEKPKINTFILIIFAGIFDIGGNICFILATQLGRLDIAAILSSFYPAVTILLAWVILKEKIYLQQKIGIIAVLIAIGFITV